MGYPSYSAENRNVRASSMGFTTVTSATADSVFKQNRERRIHEEMMPSKALLRESRDSENHPNSMPIIIALDTTGSMGEIPVHLVKDGLPKLVSNVIQKGIPDPQILFLGVGDHECDQAPLQVGQFESGDAELDLWLTRTWIEKGGGGNAGESYLLAWYFASQHTSTDCFEKRGQKGLLFTIGDEPCLRDLPRRSVEELMGKPSQSSYTDVELLEMAQKTYDVYHIHIMQGSAGPKSLGYWQKLLGQNCVVVNDYDKVSDVISNIIISNVNSRVITVPKSEPVIETGTSTSRPGKKPKPTIESPSVKDEDILF
jgi:hypothetical protein